MKRGEGFDLRGAWIVGIGLLALGGAALSGCGSENSGGGGSTTTTTKHPWEIGGGGTGGSEPSCDPPPQEEDAFQHGTITVHNTGADMRYLLTKCNNCETLRVEQQGDIDYVPLTTVITPADACGCECEEAPVYPLKYHRIQPGDVWDMKWDGRVIETCTHHVDCGNGETAQVTVGGLQPTHGGWFRLSVGVIQNLPADCTEMFDSDEFNCVQPAQPSGLDPGGGWYPVEILMGATGDSSVDVTVP